MRYGSAEAIMQLFLCGMCVNVTHCDMLLLLDVLGQTTCCITGISDGASSQPAPLNVIATGYLQWLLLTQSLQMTTEVGRRP